MNTKLFVRAVAILVLGLLAVTGVYEAVHSHVGSVGFGTSEAAPDYAHMSAQELQYQQLLDQTEAQIKNMNDITLADVNNVSGGPAERELAIRSARVVWEEDMKQIYDDAMSKLYAIEYQVPSNDLNYTPDIGAVYQAKMQKVLSSPQAQKIRALFENARCPV